MFIARRGGGESKGAIVWHPHKLARTIVERAAVRAEVFMVR
jgi:hypothetical protein